MRVFVLLATFAAGVWIGGRFIGPNNVPSSGIADYRKYMRELLSRSSMDLEVLNDEEARQVLIDDLVQAHTDRERWRSRRELQRPVAIVFWFNIGIAILFHAIRGDPGPFDSTLVNLPQFISKRIPYFLGRWRLEVYDANGRIVLTQVYRTLRVATRVASEHTDKGERIISWDNSAHDAYRAYKKRRARKSADL